VFLIFNISRKETMNTSAPFGEEMVTIRIPLEYAKYWHGQLGIGIQQAEQASTGRTWNPPVLTEDGFLTYEAARKFFAQIYVDDAVLKRRVGRLFSRVALFAANGTIDFEVVCTKCDQDLRDRTYVPVGHSHKTHRSFRRYALGASSLINDENALRFHRSEVSGMGGERNETKEDFVTLVTHLT